MGKNLLGIKNQDYKLIVKGGDEEFYDYQKDLLELNPLPINELDGVALDNYNLLKEEVRKLGVE